MHFFKSIFRKTTLTLFLGIAMTVFAIPANDSKGIAVQPDGSNITITLSGDEFSKLSLTDDDYSLINLSGAYYYATLNNDGVLVSTGVLAHNKADRTNQEQLFVSTLTPHMAQSPSKSRMFSVQRHLNRGLLGPKRVNGATFPVTGKRRTLIVLVDFSDVNFVTSDTYNTFNDMLNKEGYNEREHIGCAADYFRIQSNGLFDPQFDVIGPIRADKSCYYYGQNDDNGDDKYVGELVLEVATKIDSTVDFSDYDLDEDGLVDNIYMFYAGYGENYSGSSSNVIWPHAWNLKEYGYTAQECTFDGVVLDSYGCCAELYGSSGSDTSAMGTFVHEFGHILGLPDAYDVNYSTNGTGYHPDKWDIMASGSYLPSTRNSGAVPAGYSGWERWLLGWQEPITINKPQHISLPSISASNIFLKIDTPNPDEYYLVENRQKISGTYDYYLPYHGMLIWHIDKSADHLISFGHTQISAADAWLLSNNALNVDATHQCLEIVKAKGSGTKSSSNTPFPGYGNITEFTDTSEPSMKTWDGDECGAPVTNITEKNGVISFDFMGCSEIASVSALEASDVTQDSFNANWETLDDTDDYELNVWKYELKPVENEVTYEYSFNEIPDGWTVTGSYELSSNYIILSSGSSNATLTSPTLDLSDGADIEITIKQYSESDSRLNVYYGSSHVATLLPPTDYATYTLNISRGVSPGAITLATSNQKSIALSSVKCRQSTTLKNKVKLDGYPIHTGDVNSYTVSGLDSETEYGYSVTAVGLVSSTSGDVSVTTCAPISAVKAIETTQPTIRVIGHELHITNPTAQPMTIVTATGARVFSTSATTAQTGSLPAGIYLAASPSSVQKLLIK